MSIVQAVTKHQKYRTVKQRVFVNGSFSHGNGRKEDRLNCTYIRVSKSLSLWYNIKILTSGHYPYLVFILKKVRKLDSVSFDWTQLVCILLEDGAGIQSPEVCILNRSQGYGQRLITQKL
jgi:hypothetical protein